MMTASADSGTGTRANGHICGISLEAKPSAKGFALVQRMSS